MRGFPTGVAVLTIDLEGKRLGLTVGSALWLSTEPPLAGVAVARAAAMHELLAEAGAFALSLLAGDQEGLAQHFARGVPPIAMWEGIEWRPGVTGAPLLDGSLGWVECLVADRCPAGDHTLFVGEVVSSEHGRSAPALVYVDGVYRVLS
jgi:flavin reductase (DIM6/NTAB) family NADH-FMN oxidoreductase RutF